MHAQFGSFAKRMARASGHPAAFLIAAAMVLAWAVSGPLFHFSDAWQLAINTCTSVVTFLMVFLIQHTQNRDTGALQVKLDELIRATSGAHVALLDLEELEEGELERVRANYRRLAAAAREARRSGTLDTKCPEVEEVDVEDHPRRRPRA
ncbi:MAG: low affinity iron permease family protein [Phycisphaerales bacterium]|nr:low affinity iron permease family protein [Phycisphaerales bacterium]